MPASLHQHMMAGNKSLHGPKGGIIACLFIALSLQLKGHNVAVIEAGKLMGRSQEWNISQKELDELIELGVLTEEDVLEAVVFVPFQPIKVNSLLVDLRSPFLKK